MLFLVITLHVQQLSHFNQENVHYRARHCNETDCSKCFCVIGKKDIYASAPYCPACQWWWTCHMRLLHTVLLVSDGGPVICVCSILSCLSVMVDLSYASAPYCPACQWWWTCHMHLWGVYSDLCVGILPGMRCTYFYAMCIRTDLFYFLLFLIFL